MKQITIFTFGVFYQCSEIQHVDDHLILNRIIRNKNILPPYRPKKFLVLIQKIYVNVVYFQDAAKIEKKNILPIIIITAS